MKVLSNRQNPSKDCSKQQTSLKKLTWLLVLWLSLVFTTTAPPILSGEATAPILEAVNVEKLKAILKKKRGKVILVNFWATWCAPCREEFPALIKLYRQYRARGLDLMLVSADNPEDREQVEAFLKQSEANFTSYIGSDENHAVLASSISRDWPYAIPTTFVFNRQGKLTKSLVGRQDYQIFQKAILKLL